MLRGARHGARRIEQGCAGAPRVRAASSRAEPQEFVNTLLAHTSLESTPPINLTMIGSDGRPTQKSLRQILAEWIASASRPCDARSRHRLGEVADRIHILEGRQLVLLNIDEVIALIRERDEPKPALMRAFRLSERQADDILEFACASWRGSRRSASTHPAVGPSTWPTATARPSTAAGSRCTGSSVRATRSSYQARICGQSVSSALAASSCRAAIAASIWYRPGR